MGLEESWMLVNVDRKERHGSCDGLQFAFFKGYDSLLAADCLTLPGMTRKVAQWIASRQPVVQTGCLSKLSVELLDLIFEHLDASMTSLKLITMISFAITCTTVLEVGKRHLLRALRAHHAYWVQGRLICLNNDLMWGDLPTGMLTDMETHELETTLSEWGYGGQHGSLYQFARELYKNALYPDDLKADRNLASHLDWRLENAEYPTRLLDIYRAEWPTAEKDTISVLCNLSKMEYVRSDIGFGLDVALLSRICWCSKSAEFALRCEGEYRERLMRGPWAGDRFCITTLDMLSEVFQGQEGKDVSGETEDLLQHLWTLRVKHPVEEKTEEPAQEGSSTKSHTIKDSSDSDDTSSESDTSTEDTSSDDSSSDDTTNDEESGHIDRRK
ncbi:hypothetical protein K466DRAFT_593178 [Polyporus arcularius HHB13444]|uniref:Uncharacterized protein n=1 Tax=Polyporus arcularius HHB13444 TaxID=1314778 RepID=A0A5C3PZE1_9APHY|nr:hypothetical protein K466DRAFT_593178 [Polyporus arcularius HHB13444]